MVAPTVTYTDGLYAHYAVKADALDVTLDVVADWDTGQIQDAIWSTPGAALAAPKTEGLNKVELAIVLTYLTGGAAD
ncbi:hypothetical protein [Nocardioides ochotonae]|uniref:hypothetical protein n=1 Tax=Nocardioides ochotonae TaxID=2685869 RepID=UPI00174C296B|nr:hypothetical protein [Nocardioides ochotonae]